MTLKLNAKLKAKAKAKAKAKTKAKPHILKYAIAFVTGLVSIYGVARTEQYIRKLEASHQNVREKLAVATMKVAVLEPKLIRTQRALHMESRVLPLIEIVLTLMTVTPALFYTGGMFFSYGWGKR